MPVAKKTTKKAPTAKKTTAKKSAAPKASTSTKSREEKAAESALKMVDEAAALLRSGIRTGAATTEKSRLAAKKKAHSLLTKASHSLSGVLEDTASVLHKVVNKL